jgi:predicted ATPase
MPSRSGMPSRLSSFVGRRKELGELRRLVAHTRLVTLLGPGGSGKTRLATEFARQQESRFPEGAIFAELGDISDGALVVEAIARAASIRLVGHDHLTTLVGQLQRRHLVVVDNCEHLVESAAEVVTRLLTGCPQLSVIATSRERLNIEGETVYTVLRWGCRSMAWTWPPQTPLTPRGYWLTAPDRCGPASSSTPPTPARC